MDKNLARVQLQGKSLGLGMLLALIFGGVGVFYFSVLGGLIGTVIEGLVWLLSILTGGLLFFLVVVWHIFCTIVAVVSINRHNQRLLNSLD